MFGSFKNIILFNIYIGLYLLCEMFLILKILKLLDKYDIKFLIFYINLVKECYVFENVFIILNNSFLFKIKIIY